MTTLRRAAGWLALGLLVAALTGGGFAGRAHAQQKVLKIGVLGVMSGPAASWGLVNRYCTEATAQMVNEQAAGRSAARSTGSRWSASTTGTIPRCPSLAPSGSRIRR